MSYFNLNGVYNLNKSDTRITGNIQVSVDTDGEIYLDTIDSNPYLENSSWKGIPIDPNLSDSFGKTINETFVPFHNLYLDKFYEKADDSIVTNRAYLNKKSISTYNSKYKYFAPIYIQDSDESIKNRIDNPDLIPSHFLIFKLKGYKYSDLDFENLDSTFLENIILNNFKLIKSIPFGDNPKIRKFLENSKGFEYDWNFMNDPDYDQSTQTDNIKISGIDISMGLSNSYFHSKSSTDDFTDEKAINVYKEFNLISSNIFNFNFLFDYDEDDTNEDEFIGFYVNKEFIEKFKLNLELYNLEFNLPINEKVKSLNENEFKLEDETGVKIKTTDTYENIYNPGSNFFYSINDKNSNFYNIKFANDNYLKLYSNEVNLSNFYDIVQNSNELIPAKFLNNKFYSNLKIGIRDIRLGKKVFDNGNWISIKPNILSNFEYRVIANDNECCNDRKICKMDNPKFIFLADEIEYENIEYLEYPGYTDAYDVYSTDTYIDSQYAKESIILSLTLNRIYKFEEGESIKLTTSKFNDIRFTIDKVEYDMKNKKTKITIIDLLGKYFKDTSKIKSIKCVYDPPSYKYTFFDPNGEAEDVADSIIESFNSFNSHMFELIKVDNSDIIIKSKLENEAFKGFTLSYDITNSNTPINTLRFNDFDAVGYTINEFYDNDEVIINRKRNKIHIFYDYKPLKSRIAIAKGASISPDDIFITKNGISTLRSLNIESNKSASTNYLDEPIIDNNGAIIGYKNVDKYNIYEIDNKLSNDEFIMSGVGHINKTERFIPSIFKYTLTDTYSD